MNETDQTEGPRFERIIRFLRIGKDRSSPKDELTIPQAIHKLDDIVRVYSGDSLGRGIASVRETSGMNFLNRYGPELWEHFRTTPEVGLMLEFQSPGVTTAEVYEHLETLKPETLSEKSRLHVTDSREHDSAIQGLLTYNCHSLHFPVNIQFFEDTEDLKTQRNGLRIYLPILLTPEKREELRKYCSERGLGLSLAEPITEDEGRTFNLNNDGILINGSTYPETRIKVSWESNNFDRRAIRIFGELRERLYPDYLETLKRYAEAIVLYEGRISEPGKVVLNLEGKRPLSPIANFVAHMSADVPFEHGGKPKTANLFYHHFYGLPWF